MFKKLQNYDDTGLFSKCCYLQNIIISVLFPNTIFMAFSFVLREHIFVILPIKKIIIHVQRDRVLMNAAARSSLIYYCPSIHVPTPP